MASVSPSSSVSQVTGEDRVGLEMPQAPSSILGDLSALADEKSRTRVAEAYYLALAKYYEAVAVVRVGDSSCVGSVVSEIPSATAVSVASSAGSRRRRRRRNAGSRVGSGVDDVSQVGVPGLSYLLLVEPGSRSLARRELGLSPTLGSLMKSPAAWFETGLRMAGVGCVVSERSVEFALGETGLRAADLFSHVAAEYRTPRGSFGAVPGKLLDIRVDRTFVVGLGSSDGLSAAELGVVRRDSVVSGVSDAEDGYCYLKLLQHEYRLIVGKMGPSLSLAVLVTLPMAWFLADAREQTVSVVGDKLLHVGRGDYRFADVVGTMLSSGTEYSCKAVAGSLSLATLGGNVLASSYRLIDIPVDYEWRVGALSQTAASLLQRLVGLSGLEASAFDTDRVELATKTAAFMSAADKIRYRMAEAVGDSALTLVIAEICANSGCSAHQFQDVRSALSNNVLLAAVADESGLLDHVSVVPGVPRTGRVGAAALEVMVSLVHEAGGSQAVHVFCQNLGIFAKHPAWVEGRFDLSV